MADPDSRPADDTNASGTGGPATGEAPDTPVADADSVSTEELRERVEEQYDFDQFGPADMAEMSPEEWEAVFDPETWITGEELLDRVEADLKQRVADRDVFARVERHDNVVVAFDESDYAAVYPDGTVEGRGTVRRDVEPTVALCSMDSYDVPEPPDGPVLPSPREIPESNETVGNTLLQVVGGVQVIAGAVLLAATVLSLVGVFPQASGSGSNLVLLLVAGVGFLLVGLFMFTVVANARLSDRFRSEAYRERLRGVGLADGDRPDFLSEVDGVEPRETASGKLSPDQRSSPGGETGGADASDGSSRDA